VTSSINRGVSASAISLRSKSNVSLLVMREMVENPILEQKLYVLPAKNQQGVWVVFSSVLVRQKLI
jgi:hypothetical protein